VAAERRESDEPGALIAEDESFGDLADNEPFAGACRSPRRSLRSRRARATIETLVAAPQKTV
jgi:hypothetical protein